MALNRQFLELMIWLAEEGHLGAGRKVVEIGAQQLNDGFLSANDAIERLCELLGRPVPTLPGPLATGSSSRLNAAAPYAKAFYEAIGYAYAYVDIDAHGGYPRDLNFDHVSAPLVGQHSLVTNFGTTEHVTNQLNAFKIVHDLAAAGGLMIHEVPAQGHLGHGFFTYQPKFFERLARSNGYNVVFFDYRWHEAEKGIPERVRRLTERFVDIRNRSEFTTSPTAIATVMRKTSEAPFVPPIDMPLDAEAPDATFADRYGNAFGRRSVARRAARLMLSYLREGVQLVRNAVRT